ncbi:hypothetical protein M2103_002081 [Ereboglobus sp. PH5-5]|uniref:hypothetical protein n=1 Tax=unclassified Ereboglobus TaxID=2626932 RepID=UPI00240711B9|nr:MULTISPECIES: hypothetical protein [unclassified Ereboglobus]MDF9826260.1 hypothetical protein [Ereboglobus sp. PH5-10]MDF9833848.1 hypothetical protein [Ereboglobus sp. PH5-5]
MLIFRRLFSNKRSLVLLALGSVVFANAAQAQAMVYSTNTGTIPGTAIEYTVTLEDDVTSRLAIRFVMRNNSDKPYFIARGAFDVPGQMSVFFSTDDTPIISSTGDWASELLPGGVVMGNLPLLPGKTINEIFPIGVYYDKIYKKRRESNVYVYWGVTMSSSSDDAQQAELEERPMRPVQHETLPRIGGMLTLPKNENGATVYNRRR